MNAKRVRQLQIQLLALVKLDALTRDQLHRARQLRDIIHAIDADACLYHSWPRHKGNPLYEFNREFEPLPIVVEKSNARA